MNIIHTIHARCTCKVLADPNRALPCPDGSERRLMARMIAAGSCAPHHYPCHESHQRGVQDAPVPWRFHALPGSVCRQLRTRVGRLDGPVEITLRLLGAANGLIMVTWLPDPAEAEDADNPDGAGNRNAGGPGLFDATRRNMEHIAATAAAVQNMLLVATEAGVPTFWSSGGPILLGSKAWSWLAIPEDQVLLGAVYLFPRETGPATVKPGARAGLKGEPTAWSRWVEL